MGRGLGEGSIGSLICKQFVMLWESMQIVINSHLYYIEQFNLLWTDTFLGPTKVARR